jgi:hypothetical protein
MNQRCNGGAQNCCGNDPVTAMSWIKSVGGIPTQRDYGEILGDDLDAENAYGITWSGNHPETPYPCRMDVARALTLASDPVLMASESDMTEYVCTTGTLQIAVDAERWQHYTGGVMTADQCSTNLDHAVIAVGLSAAENAWIVQNSWGNNWGVSKDGARIELDQYTNCRELKQEGGCNGRITTGERIGAVCKQACEETTPGGFIYLEYGKNTCGMSQKALAASTVQTILEPPN